MRRILPYLALLVATSSGGAPTVVELPPRGTPERPLALGRLHASGVRVVGALGRDALLVESDATLPEGARARAFTAEDALAPGAESHRGALVVHPLPGTSLEALLASARAAAPAPWRRTKRWLELDRAPPGAARAVARLPGVLAVVPVPGVEAAGFESWGLLHSGTQASRPFHAAGMAGQGEILAVADSGLNADCFFEDPAEAYATEVVDPGNPPLVPATSPAHRKIQAYQAHAASDFVDDGSSPPFHGTQVAGVAVADAAPHADQVVNVADALPARANAEGADGHVTAARLVVQDLRTSGPYAVPVDLAGLLTAAHRAGARTWSASWTSGPTCAGEYDHYARELDVAADRHPDLTITAAAGNQGPAPGTACPPSTARNGLSVGNGRTGSSPEDVHGLSSIGPAADGRLKPDLTAPGTSVLTARGDSACATLAQVGTSIAAPAAASAAVLVRQYLREGREGAGTAESAAPRLPSSALVRALLALSARSMAGGANSAVLEQPAPSPEQGWGRIVLADALPLPASSASLVVHADDDWSSAADGFPAGATTPLEWTLEVLDGSVPLEVALAFTDEPPLPAAPSPVVNDLDLEVVSPGGATYLGNVLAAGVSVTGGAPDPLDNLELVRVVGPEPGTWTLRVRPTDVVAGPQAHALASVARSCRPAGSFARPTVVAEVECGQVAISAPSVGGTPPVTYALARAAAPGMQDFGSPLVAGLDRAAVLDEPPGVGPYFYAFEAVDACGTRTRSAETAIVLSAPCVVPDPLLLVTRPSPGIIRLTWGDLLLRDVRRHLAPSAVRGAPPVATSSSGFHEEPLVPAPLTCWVVD